MCVRLEIVMKNDKRFGAVSTNDQSITITIPYGIVTLDPRQVDM
jgi:hypothetical protein